MKRCLTPLAALLLAFALCLPAHAASCSTALTRTSGAGGSGEILAPFACGGNLYALCRSGIFSLEGEKVSYALNPAPDGAVELAQPFSWQGETAFVAYNLRQDAEEIEIEGVCLYTAAIDPAGGLLLSAELPLNGWEDFETEYAAFESLPMPSAAVALKNQLFFSFPQEYQTRIVVADADSGECEILILDGNVHILPFQEDRLLTYETQSGAIGALSVEDHAHSALGSLPAGISGMHYHPAENCLFYVLDGELYAASGDGSAASVCALPISQSNAFSLLCMEDILYISDGDLLLGITQSVVVGQIDHRTGIVEPTSENPVFGVRRLDDSIADNSDRIQRQRLSGIGCREDVEPRGDVAGQLAVSVVSQHALCHAV